MNELYDEIEKLIESIAGHKGILFESGSFSGVGWFHTLTHTNNETTYPNIVIKKQTNAVHIYYAFWKFNKEEKEHFISIFGKSAIGKSCIRLNRMTTERKETLALIINRCKET